MSDRPYTGYFTVSVNDPEVSKLYKHPNENLFNLMENEYLFIVDDSEGYGTVVDKFKWQDGIHKTIYHKPVESLALNKVKPKNAEQSAAIDALLDNTTTVKVLTGCFGSGKDFLMAACAFQLLSTNQFDKIMWIRNNVEVKNSNPIGHLKGDYYDKMIVWAMPLADHIGGKEALDMYIRQGKVEVEHLGFLRGRDIKRTIVLCSEAEHLTRQHVQLILGRISEGSILYMNGDFRQIDSSVFEKNNGLLSSIERLAGNRLFSYINLRESVRSETAKLADLLD